MGLKRKLDGAGAAGASPGQYSAHELAAALGCSLLADEVLTRYVVPHLRGHQRLAGSISVAALAAALAEALSADSSGRVTTLLHQYQIEAHLSSGLQHASVDAAAILCASLSVDPWNCANACAACQVGNLSQAPPTLADALRFHRGKQWTMDQALTAASVQQDATQTLQNYSPLAKNRFKLRRTC